MCHFERRSEEPLDEYLTKLDAEEEEEPEADPEADGYDEFEDAEDVRIVTDGGDE